MKTEKTPAPQRAGTDPLDDTTKAEWLELAERLLLAGPEKFDEVLGAMRELVDAQEIISKFDWQLMMRGRPRKQYQA